MLVRAVESLLFDAFPAANAEPWDRVGLTVGDPMAQVTGVACALDARPETIAAASANDCNVLVTHHPAYHEPPETVAPPAPGSSLASQTVWEAVRQGVALIAMHTNLDRSNRARLVAPSLTSLPYRGRLQEPDGYGCLLDGQGLTVGEVAERFGEAYGCSPTLYGDPDAPSGTVAYSSGSLGDMASEAAAMGCGAVVGGELGYHRCLDAVARGCAVILLGHDVSELPFARLIAQTVAEAEDSVPVVTLAEQARWHICLDPRSIV